MIIPYMPLAMWWTTGWVPQWYMNTPGEVALNEYVRLFPGMTSRNARFGAMRAAWKSMECGIDALLRMVTFTTSPTRARMTGPGTLGPKVQTVTTLPGAISTFFSDMSMTT